MGINWKHRKVIVSIVMCVLLCVTAITAMMYTAFGAGSSNSDVTPNNGDHFDYVFDKEEFKNTTGSDEAGDNSLYILKLILGKCGFII